MPCNKDRNEQIERLINTLERIGFNGAPLGDGPGALENLSIELKDIRLVLDRIADALEERA